MCPLVFLAWAAKILLSLGALLTGSNPRQSQSSPFLAAFFVIVALLGAGLFILQIVLVHRSKDYFVASAVTPAIGMAPIKEPNTTHSSGSVLGLHDA